MLTPSKCKRQSGPRFEGWTYSKFFILKLKIATWPPGRVLLLWRCIHPPLLITDRQKKVVKKTQLFINHTVFDSGGFGLWRRQNHQQQMQLAQKRLMLTVLIVLKGHRRKPRTFEEKPLMQTCKGEADPQCIAADS